ncbi:hypothetical protein [Streptomyces sp. NBC_00120]|uniref:hypothetical protein n=1 Tax=Streptomyces sp. NBC_00120 TaxID=2975660 RepID=UPI00224CFAED|nr:hypothetical protein [Streptomyces sp. NBC_00120]MCX5326327.1 hypothetical protein [Streptomyces sp. NBC_00120]
MQNRGVLAAAAVATMILLGGCGSDGKSYEPGKEPTSGPEYDAAMERCALSRLRNGGEDEPSPESRNYLDAYTACTYGKSYDDVSAPARGWGPADPGYWAADE